MSGWEKYGYITGGAALMGSGAIQANLGMKAMVWGGSICVAAAAGEALPLGGASVPAAAAGAVGTAGFFGGAALSAFGSAVAATGGDMIAQGVAGEKRDLLPIRIADDISSGNFITPAIAVFGP